MKNHFSVPILFLVFNRPEATYRVFQEIKRVKPDQLYIAADGPRPGKAGELEKCEATRNLILDGIDWDCEVKTLFREKNLGCGPSVSGSITWFFEQEEEGIILEDDCLPNSSFFNFCDELLQKYRYDERISAISGNNFQLHQPMSVQDDYYYSVFPSSWGWATWRRAWKGYQLVVSDWEKSDNTFFINDLFEEKEYRLWWSDQYEYFYNEKPVHTWDFQFHFHSMRKGQLAAIPKANLVSNIGHGPDATHFHDPTSHFADMPTFKLSFPLRHPEIVSRNYEADRFVQNLLFGKVEIESRFKKAKRLIKKIICYQSS